MALALKEATELTDKLWRAGYPDFVISAELRKLKIGQGDFKVESCTAIDEDSEDEDSVDKYYMIKFSMPRIEFNKDRYDELLNVAKELGLELKANTPYTIHLNKIEGSEQMFSKKVPVGIKTRVVELTYDSIEINTVISNAEEILEKIGSRVYGAKKD